ncbi:hypothetical protein GCM10023321_35010 [Pseudonocardia eucalypti]|uniref:Uncharacterized protein n=1 Tax=Pseudonocardia eucalypti TaxID=648755 RepID=A0ABP9Q7G5_9PSEU|nr:hypothetical protein [Pseudonocardia eucalypti]
MTGFTLALCRADGCTGGTRRRGPVDHVLADATRRSEHGVLVVTGCLLGPLLCPAARAARTEPAAGAEPTSGNEAASGRAAMIQPCHPSRRPSGPSLLIGPIRGEEDARELSRWLDTGEFSSAALPTRLCGYADLLARGPSN